MAKEELNHSVNIAFNEKEVNLFSNFVTKLTE